MNDSHLRTMQRAAEAGARQLQSWRTRFGVTEKALRDLVTDADFASQQVIREELERDFPDYAFVGEEMDASKIPDAVRYQGQPCWIVDPLDGTMNYVHGLSGYAVSIALYRDGDLQAATVYDPLSEELFTAAAGSGAMLNGSPLRVSDCRELGEGLVACSFPARVERDSPEVKRCLAVLPHCQGLRRLGSAALNLCYVAAGRLDAYWATNVHVWDVAAGFLLVREAGGVVRYLDPEGPGLWKPQFCAAASETLAQQLITTFDEVP